MGIDGNLKWFFKPLEPLYTGKYRTMLISLRTTLDKERYFSHHHGLNVKTEI